MTKKNTTPTKRSAKGGKIDCSVLPFPLVSIERYILECVSSINPKRLTFKNKAIVLDTNHHIYKITVAVTNTSRAAMAEFSVILRPPVATSKGYLYIEETSSVRNQIGQLDVNHPVLFFNALDSGALSVRLASFPFDQRVAIQIERWYFTASSDVPSSSIPREEINVFPEEA